jgi:hypothetical protein
VPRGELRTVGPNFAHRSALLNTVVKSWPESNDTPPRQPQPPSLMKSTVEKIKVETQLKEN